MESFKTVSNLLKIHEKHDLNEKYVFSFNSKTMITFYGYVMSGNYVHFELVVGSPYARFAQKALCSLWKAAIKKVFGYCNCGK